MLTVPELLIMFKGIPTETIAAAVYDERLIPGVTLRKDYKDGGHTKDSLCHALAVEYRVATPENMQRVEDCARQKMAKLATERAKKKEVADRVSAGEELRRGLLREWQESSASLPWANSHGLQVSRNAPLLVVAVPARLIWLHGTSVLSAIGCKTPPATYGWEYSQMLSLFLTADQVRQLSTFWLSLSDDDKSRISDRRLS